VKIRFTAHAEYQLIERSILKQEVLDTINYPDSIAKKHGKHLFRKRLQRGLLEAVCEKTETHIKVITIYFG